MKAVARLCVLGSFALRVGDKALSPPSTQKARALLTFLVSNRAAEVARERLVELFWPDTEPQRARDSLKTALWSIRRSFRTAGLDPDAFLRASKSTVRWVAECTFDAEEIEALARSRSVDEADRALALYAGDFLEGDYDDWVVAERERIAAAYESVLSHVVKRSSNETVAQKLIARNPYDEAAYAALATAELSANRPHAAAALVDRCRTALAEVGAVPSADFERRFGGLTATSRGAEPPLALPFAGRESELSILGSAIAQTRKGRGSFTVVCGEAGIGKSSLLRRAIVEAASGGVRTLIVRCFESDARTFGPWHELYEEITKSDFETLIRDQRETLAHIYPGVLLAALDQPLALFVDDVHNLNGVSFEILVSFAKAAESRCAVIATSRPEGLARLRAALQDADYEEITLGKLDRAQLSAALGQLIGEGEGRLFNLLYDRSEGHPLFFTSLLQSLANAGTLRREGRRWSATADLEGKLDLPPTLRRFIEGRLKARGDDAALLAGALALEPQADASDLTSVLPIGAPRVYDALDDLLALGLIVESRSGPPFEFSHDLVREVASTMLNAGRRSQLHRSFAQRLAEHPSADSSLRRARHLRGTGELLAAGDAFHRAAMESMDWFAFGDAIDRSTEGIDAVKRLDRSPARDEILALLLRVISGARCFAGDPKGAIPAADEAVSLARASTDPLTLTRTLLSRGVVLSEAGWMRNQLADAREATALARSIGDDVLLAKSLVQDATAAITLGETDEAISACSTALEIAQAKAEWGLAGAAAAQLATAQIACWRFADACTTLSRGFDLARRAQRSNEATMFFTRAMFFFAVDRFDESGADLRRTVEIASGRRGPERFRTGGLSSAALTFGVQYQSALISAVRCDWDAVLAALAIIDDAAPKVLGGARFGNAAVMLRIDALLGRGRPGDVDDALRASHGLDDDAMGRSELGWSDFPTLERARVQVRLGDKSALPLLKEAAAEADEWARRVPLDADRAFDKIAQAATEFGDAELEEHAIKRRAVYREQRAAAAGASWGGSSALALHDQPH